jgi:hypothetical protein
MHLAKRAFGAALAAIVGIAASPGAGMARGFDQTPMARTYSGSYPVTVTGTEHGDFTGCLTLSGSGSASLVIGTQKYNYGSFLVTNHTFVATIQAQGYGQNAGLLFIAPATRKLNLGVYEDVYGGENFESGALAFGAKGGC